MINENIIEIIKNCEINFIYNVNIMIEKQIKN